MESFADTQERPKLVLICGPTAVGKTSAAIRMAERFAGDVVNADSMQVYRYMDIGTAKPTSEETRRVVHYMIDVADPDEAYDAARFSREGRAAVRSVATAGRLPVVAGGTGLYIRTLLYGVCDALPEDARVRARLKAEALESGSAAMHRRLAACDPGAAAKIHPNDAYRIIRAIEVYESSGIPVSEFRRRHGFSDAPYDVLKLGLSMDRPRLYDRIDRRVGQMIEEGLREEVESLLEAGYPENLKSMQSLGYRHLAAFIKGKTDLDTAVYTLKRDTRRYAKRQLSWFGNDPDVKWFHPDGIDRMADCVADFLRA